MKFTVLIELGELDGCPLLSVHDYELHDFLEDYFLDLGMETSPIRPPGSRETYQLLFRPSASVASVWLALEAIGQSEIERIVAINSGAKTPGPRA